MPSKALQEIVEYRGVEGLVAAEVLKDDNTNGYVTGDVFAIAGVAEISKTTDSSNEAHYYDNIPAVVVSNTSSDTVTISASAIPLDVQAIITGQNYDAASGALIEGPRDMKYFAIGYRTKKTNGDEMYVWRYKGTFNIPDQTNATENDSTDANGQEIVYTGISTTHKFTKTGKGAKALVVDVTKSHADVSNFFDSVVTPDTLTVNDYDVTASFNANGGTGSIASIAGVATDEGFSVSLPAGSGPEDPTPSGLTPPSEKTFAGWALSPNSATVYGGGQGVVIYNDTTFYAIWR